MKSIKSIEIKNSSFYEDMRIDFSDKLNCIMGGRGAGKTTLLYFLKASLEKNIEEEEKALKVLKSNLGDGTINVEIEDDDGNSYVVTKTLFELPQPYEIPSMEYISIEKIFAEIECDFYEAGKIERIGNNSKDRLDLIDKMIKNELSERKDAIKFTQFELEANAHDLLYLDKRILQIDEIVSQFDSIEEEFEVLRLQQPTGINSTDKDLFEKADTSEKTRKIERRFFSKAIDRLSDFNNQLENIDIEISEFYISEIDNPEDFDNKEMMSQGIQSLKDILAFSQKNIRTTIESNKIASYKIGEVFNKLLDKHDQQQAQFVQLKQKFEQNKEYINRYNSLSRNISEKLVLNKDRKELMLKRSKLMEARQRLLNQFGLLKQSIFSKRLEAIKELNKSFNGDIIISLDFGGLKEEYIDMLRSSLKGSGLQYNNLVPRLTFSFTPEKFVSIVQEGDFNSLQYISGIDEIRSKAIIKTLQGTEELFRIQSIYCNDLPEFKLRIADDARNLEDNYKATSELSMGQKCTTVLPIIFAVSKNPLIIDQPEDNLDNKYITKRIHEIIRQQKEKRQLIFITHNPNIPVLSNSDFNVFLNYHDRKSTIEKTGNVDEVTPEIVSLLEGGALAFEKRMEIYGYDK